MPFKDTRVLLIEDNPADARLVEITLSGLTGGRFSITHADRLSHALDLLAGKAFDAILLDLSLPDSFGLDTVREVRSIDPGIPIIVLSGLLDENVAVQAVKMGAQDYLVKGQENGWLIARSIRYAMERQRIEEELRVAREELERRVQERTLDLIEANKRLREEMAERKLAEDKEKQRMMELAHVSRLSAMGEMTTQIAHEINQPLTAIASYADACQQLLQSRAPDLGMIGGAMKEISTQATRAGEIIRQLRSFVRKDNSHRSTVDINSLVQEVVRLITVEGRWHGVNVLLDLTGGLPPLIADKILIEQVILNLARNAIEAMAGIGQENRRVTIQTRNHPGETIEVAIHDNGPGLPDGGAERVFESFYTTKPDGIGMGLSICRSIIKAHDGHLWAENGPDRGAVFRFTLPYQQAQRHAH